VATDLVAETLAELSGAWVDSAARQRNKRFGTGLPEDARERARQMRFLQQRGFTGDQIRAVFRL
jgi:regulatory protein